MSQGLTLLAIALQSVGKVLYGTFLAGISAPLFVLVSVLLTACVFLAGARFQLPQHGRGLLAMANVWTAIGFISVFFALKFLPPAMFAAIEIGVSLLTAIALTAIQSNAWPRLARLLACSGIIVGCALLSWAEVAFATGERANPLVWIAIAASVATGATSALSATTCKKLSVIGWSPAAMLAHRFYLTIALAAVWLAMDRQPTIVPEAGDIALIAMVGTVAIVVPLLLFQIALRRTDELTLLICMALQPILSFAFSLPSPAYDWSTLTLLGVLTVSLFVGLDIYMQPRAVHVRQTRPRHAAGAGLASNLPFHQNG